MFSRMQLLLVLSLYCQSFLQKIGAKLIHRAPNDNDNKGFIIDLLSVINTPANELQLILSILSMTKKEQVMYLHNL